MRAEDLPDIGEIERDVWSSILPASDGWGWGSSYSGAYSTVDGSQVGDVIADRIARVHLTFGESPEGYGSTDMAILVELTDGTWAACMAWSDTTGFGCQDDVQWKVAPTRAEAISQGLDREARRKLGVLLPGEEATDG